MINVRDKVSCCCSLSASLVLSVIGFLCFERQHTYIHTNLYSAKNRENESEALAQDD